MKYNRYQKRNAIKNYFPLPNEIFSLDLSAGEIAVYAYLLRLENRNTYQCWPSFKTIGKAVGMCNNTVSKYVAGLEDKCLITTEPTKVYNKDGKPQNGNLLYTIRPIQEAIDHHFQGQMAGMEADNAKSNIAKKLAEFDRNRVCEPVCSNGLGEAGNYAAAWEKSELGPVWGEL